MSSTADDIAITQVNNLDRQLIDDTCDLSLYISSHVSPPFDQSLSLSIATDPVVPYTKKYSYDTSDFESVDGSDSFLAVITARATGDRPRGYILLSKDWNNMCLIEDIAVDNALRGRGIGRQLIEKAIVWAKEKGLSTLRAETQSNNVQACQFYRKCGFKFGGYDEYLYSALNKSPPETALYWYLFLDD